MAAYDNGCHSRGAARFLTNSPNSQTEISLEAGHPLAMLTAIYIEALLVDANLADQVWELWDAEVIDDHLVFIAWFLIVTSYAI